MTGIHHKDNTMCPGIATMSPKMSHFVATTGIPKGEANVTVFDGLDIEPNRGDSDEKLS